MKGTTSWIQFDRRLIQFIHLWDLPKIIHVYGWWTMVYWPLEWILGLLHFSGIGHVILHLIGLTNRRKLTEKEIGVAQSIFGDRLPYDSICIHDTSIFARKLKIAFVTGLIIQTHGQISDRLLIHELTHVYQYCQVGLVYIPRCLFAQHTPPGYDFGSLDQHLDIINGTAKLGKLNYEQQAEFLATLHEGKLTLDLPRGSNRTLLHLNFEL
jgi:hypothetical protein